MLSSYISSDIWVVFWYFRISLLFSLFNYQTTAWSCIFLPSLSAKDEPQLSSCGIQIQLHFFQKASNHFSAFWNPCASNLLKAVCVTVSTIGDGWKVDSEKVFSISERFLFPDIDHRIFGFPFGNSQILIPDKFSILLYSIFSYMIEFEAALSVSLLRSVQIHQRNKTYISDQFFSLERRWSSRTFRYGYLVTTSP